jgi:hypothetical protein
MLPSPLPRRLITVTFTLLLGLTSFGLAGCPGDLDPRLMSTTPAPPCDAPGTVFDVPPNHGLCATLGCHDATPTAQAGLNLTNDAGLAGRLLGVMPSGTNGSVCTGVTMPYLVVGSEPATGLLLDKMFATNLPCSGGNRMPSLGTLKPQDPACITSWANALTKP